MRTGAQRSKDGSFYGTTFYGGASNLGSVYRITPGVVVTILHSFRDSPTDGYHPKTGLVEGKNGVFYGTTEYGGQAYEGTIYKITARGIFTIVHSFGDGSVTNDGDAPAASLILGNDGTFYGTTSQGGATGHGTAFKVTPGGKVTIIHSFSDGSVPNDGSTPFAGLTEGTNGNFYGTTYEGGSGGGPGATFGTAFEITPHGTVTILHSFSIDALPMDGYYPEAKLIQASDGSLYGTTTGSSDGTGEVIFKIAPDGDGYTVVHDFGDGSVVNDGTLPLGSLIQGKNGSLYGTTRLGGASVATQGAYGAGTMFTFGPDAPPDPKFFRPATSPVGTIVTITGKNFGGVTAIHFHHADATTFAVNEDGTKITVTVPRHARSGRLTITTAAGSVKTEAPFTVTSP